ncbi:MAG TPA: NAD(P)/FAD-dependent oxidoreductase [Planctomycetota bacterium]|jgi:NADH dehydrogenase|nr:NAD(P)/FAD-dependent oxidoreductase [Planctomycetota bacterium]
MAGTATLPHVVILGGGFGGLLAARGLARAPVRVTLVDRKNHHLFQPLLYQVAAAELDPEDIAAPIRWILRGQENATVLLAEARTVDLAAKKVFLADGELSFDTLVVAAGARHSYFGHDEWEGAAPGLKTVEDALEIRRRVLSAFEAAEREPDPDRRREWLTFAIVGGGPTGVEMAGALVELAHHTLSRDFRRIRTEHTRVVLVEGLPHVLAAYPESLQVKAEAQLAHLGVEVRCGVRVTGIDATGLVLGEERLPTRTVVWAAGVEASPLGRSLEAPLDRAGRVKVTPELTVPGRDDVFVIGDMAALEEAPGKLVPGVAPAAMQMGRHTARNIVRALDGKPLLPFHYRDKGMLATIGRSAAVADLGFLRISGFPAWIAWLGLHIFFLIGFRNRIVVLVNWAWAYVTFQRGGRLIT